MVLQARILAGTGELASLTVLFYGWGCQGGTGKKAKTTKKGVKRRGKEWGKEQTPLFAPSLLRRRKIRKWLPSIHKKTPQLAPSVKKEKKTRKLRPL